MKRHIFLIPGFFGFANLGDFAYWGPVHRKLSELLDNAGMPAELHCVKSLPTASLRLRTRCLLETIADADPGPRSVIHLIGHSTGGLDSRLLLTPAMNLQSDIDASAYIRRVRSSISVATPHLGAPIASFFASVLGNKLLKLLSVITMEVLRRGEIPLSVWTQAAGLFALPDTAGAAAGSLASQLYNQLLKDFNAQRRAQVTELLSSVERDQALLTQLTVESMDLFNAAAGDRAGVAYGSVVTKATHPTLADVLEIGLDPIGQAQHAFYYSLGRLAAGDNFPPPEKKLRRAMRRQFGSIPDSATNDGIVPTLSQQWGHCIALARADHLDIIGHYSDAQPASDGEPQYDWLSTRTNFSTAQFSDVWRRVVRFMAAAEQR
tara:strand:- start:5488 stop:6621 length:1134 start_codon:yes stop_codon:yes gene_type:complete